jgi:Mg2+/Co2+ transporter CorB
MSQKTLHFVSFLAGFLVFSSLHIVIGEQVPKTLAIRQPMPVSQWIAYPLHVSYLIFWPLNWLLNSASRGILRLLGVKESSQHEILTDSEIEGLVEESAVHGGIESGEAEYIHNVFRFGDLAVSDVMVHRTAMMLINADLPPDELVREVLATEYTRIPLWRDKPENIIGVLHAKDLLRAIRASEGDTSRINVSAIMLPPWFVPEMRPLSEQLKAFRRRKTHFALVVDEYGEVEGMVTLEDILEEIVGDISDEHDIVVAGVRAQPDGSVAVDGSVPIRDLNRAMDWSLPDEEATTIAGLVIHEARSIPERGQSFTFHGFRFRVLRRERNRITALRIVPVPREPEVLEPKPRRAGTSF